MSARKHKPFYWALYDFIKVTAALPGLIWLRPKWIFASPAARRHVRGGAVVIANHVGFLDPVYVMMAVWYRRHRFVCMQEFFESRWRWLFQGVRCIPVDRDNVRLQTLREITDVLKADGLVSLFPEGHIQTGGNGVSGFKSGMVLMALQGKAPILPVFIQPPARWYHRLRMVIGEPVDPAALYGPRPTVSQIEEIARLLEQRENTLRDLVARPEEKR